MYRIEVNIVGVWCKVLDFRDQRAAEIVMEECMWHNPHNTFRVIPVLGSNQYGDE